MNHWILVWCYEDRQGVPRFYNEFVTSQNWTVHVTKKLKQSFEEIPPGSFQNIYVNQLRLINVIPMPTNDTWIEDIKEAIGNQ